MTLTDSGEFNRTEAIAEVKQAIAPVGHVVLGLDELEAIHKLLDKVLTDRSSNVEFLIKLNLIVDYLMIRYRISNIRFTK